MEQTAGKRRSIRWFPLALGILLAVIVVLYLGLRTDFFARIAGRVASERFLAGTPFVVTVDKVEGSFLQDVTLKGLKIRYRGPGVPFDLFRADEVSVRYGLPRLARHARLIEEISVTKPVLRLKADSTGAFIFPSFGAGKGPLPQLAIERFSIEDGHAIVQGAKVSEALNDVNLVGSVRSGGDTLVLRIAQGSGQDAERAFALRSLSGGITLMREAARRGTRERGPARVALDSLAVTLDESAFTASGTVVPSSRLFDLVVDAEPVSLDEVKRIFHLDTSHYGEVKGTFTVRGEPSRFRLSGSASGVLSGYALRDFRVDLFREKGVVRIDSLDGSLNGGRVRGSGRYALAPANVLTLDVDVADIDLSRGFVPKKKLPETRFNGAATLEYRVRDEALSFELHLGEGDLLGFPFAEASVTGAYARDTLRIDDAVLKHPTHTVSGRGRIVGDKNVSFLFDVDCAASDTLFGYFKIQDYRGNAHLNGRWEGTFDDWGLRMNGGFDSLSYYIAHVPKGEIKLSIDKAGLVYSGLVEIEGPGCSIGRAAFGGLSLSLEFKGESTTIKRLHLTREDLTADLAADVERKGGKGAETRIRLGDCSLEALGETWRGGGAFTVAPGDTLVQVQDLQLHSREGALRAEGEVALKSRTARGRVSFERLGLELFNRAGLTKTPLGGRARGEVRCSGRYEDPDLGIDVAVEDGKVDTFVIDTLRIAAVWAQGRCAVDSLVASSPTGALRVAGEVSGFTAADLYRRGSRAITRANVSLASSCRNLDMTPLLSLAGVRLVSAGRLSGSLSVRDSLAHPFVSFKGRIEKVALSSLRIPSIEGNVTIDGKTLSVEGALHVSPSHTGSFRGAVPLVPARFLYALDREGPVSLEVEVPEGDLGDITGVTDLVAEGGGRYSGRLSVRGTVASPRLFGDLRLRNASFRLAGMEERFSQAMAVIQLEDSLITIKEFTAREGKKGSIACTGSVSLRGWRPAGYRLSMTANDFVLASIDDILAIVSGSVNVSTAVVNGKAIPNVTGSCVVKQSEISYDLGNLSSATETGTVLEPTWVAAIDLSVPGNTWIRTSDARVELQGDVTLYHDAQGTYFRGELNLLRGWYNIYNNKFTITSGKLQFVTAGSFRPVVDVEAETKDPEGRTIYLTLQWHQDDLQPKLSLRHEDPAYSETDIWKMLGGGVVAGEGQGASWDAKATAQGLAANYLERLLNSQMEGLTIELESSHATGETSRLEKNLLDTRIAIGKYLSQGLYVKYKQGLSISSAREIDVEYRISNLFVVRSQVIRYYEKAVQGNSPRTSDEINVDLKLRWEF